MADEPKHEDSHSSEHHTHEHAEHAKEHHETHEKEHHEHHEHHVEHKEHHKTHHKMFDFTSTNVMIALAVLLIVVLGANGYLSGMFNPSSSSQQQQAQPPATLQLITITKESCTLCFDISTFSSGISQLDGVNVTAEKSIDISSSEAEALISKYDIQKIPTVVITGQINDSRLSAVWQQIGEVKNDAVIVSEVPPPYFDITTSKVIGLVTFTAITDSTCADCSKVDDMITSFGTAGIVFSENTTLDYSAKEAKTLVSKYNITKLPVIIFSDDLGVYSIINSSWKNLGTIASDGAYVLTETTPPFKNISTGKVQGIVNVTYLVDGSCTACYNVSMHRDILINSFRLTFDTENTYDINSTQGKALVSKYNITKVPTFIVSPDGKYYNGLMQVWPTVGTNETDGWFVFRDMSAIGGATYKDLATGEIVNGTTG